MIEPLRAFDGLIQDLRPLQGRLNERSSRKIVRQMNLDLQGAMLDDKGENVPGTEVSSSVKRLIRNLGVMMNLCHMQLLNSEKVSQAIRTARSRLYSSGIL